MSTTSTNMGLIIPTVGVDSGTSAATDVNNSLTIIDAHSHSAGSGVPITPAGLNINSDLSMGGNNLFLARTVRFSPQVSAIANTGTDIGILYVAGNELYYNDVSGGHQVPITSNGSVNAGAGSITGLPSGTASASFSGGVFIFQSATSTPANIDGGSFVFRNNSANSKGLTLAPPNAMGANYSLVLPSLPVSQLIMTLDSSGNMSAPYSVDNSTIEISSNVIRVKDGGITLAKMANNSVGQPQAVIRTVPGSTAGAGNIALAGSSGADSTTGGAFVGVSGQVVTLTSLGNPIRLEVLSDGTGNDSNIFANAVDNAEFRIVRDGVEIYRCSMRVGVISPPSTNFITVVPPGAINHVDVVAAGTYVYGLQFRVVSAGTVGANFIRLMAYEIK